MGWNVFPFKWLAAVLANFHLLLRKQCHPQSRGLAYLVTRCQRKVVKVAMCDLRLQSNRDFLPQQGR